MKKRGLALLLGALMVASVLNLRSNSEAVDSEVSSVVEESAVETPETLSTEVILPQDQTPSNQVTEQTQEQAAFEAVENQSEAVSDIQTGERIDANNENGNSGSIVSDDEKTKNQLDFEADKKDALEAEESDSEDEDSEEEEFEEDKPFSETKTVGGVRITLTAEAGVLPEGAYFEAVEITNSSDIKAIESAVESELSDEQIITKVKAFDITIFDAQNQEIQPAGGSVKITFDDVDTDDAGDTQVYHLDDSMSSATEVAVSVSDDKVIFEAEHFSPYVVVSVEDIEAGSTEEIDENALIDSIKIYKNNDPNDTITNNSSVSLKDKINVSYVFKDVTVAPKNMPIPDTGEDIIVVRPGETYKIPGIPDICDTPNDISVHSGDVILGKVTFKNGEAFLKIEDFDEPTDATDAEAGFDLQLNLDEEADKDQDSYELAFGTKAKVTIKIDEFTPKPPTVEKTKSELDDEGKITWTVTVKNASNPIQYADGYTFKDEFSEGQDYVKDSFKITKGSGAVTPTNSGNTLTWKYTNNEPDSVTQFEYKTAIDIIALTKNATEDSVVNKTVSNKVSVTSPAGNDYDKLNISDSESQEVSRAVKSWVTKTGSKVNANGEADWKVVIQNNGFTLKNLVLTDTIKVADGVNVTVSNLTVQDASNNNVDYSLETDGGVQIIKFKKAMSGNAQYTITYRTKIEDFETYIKKNYPVPENSANITYDYESAGTQKDVHVVGPTISKPFEGDFIHAKAAIEKSAGKVDLVNHTITWNVVVNRSKQDLENVKIIDTLPDGLDFVGISSVKDVDTPDSSITVGATTVTIPEGSITTNGRKVIIPIGDINKEIVEFTVITKLDDTQSEVWASNKEKTYKNIVTLTSTDFEEEDGITDSATKKYSSNVLKKTASKYNYNDHTIDYTLTVNSNQMAMTNVVITDELEDRLEYVADSAAVDVGTVEIVLTGNTLSFKLGDIDGQRVITFKARVRDGQTFENTDSFDISNDASLTSTEYSIATTTAPVVTKVNNDVITKDAVQDPTNKEIIRYTVGVNPAQQQLYNGVVDKVVIQDTLGASLVLDDESIKLFEATVSADGKLTQGTEVASPEFTIDDRSARTVLQVTVPKEPGNKAYILTYTASMLDKKANDFGNDVVLKGYGSEASNKANKSFSQNDFTNVKLDKYVYYLSELRDANDEEIPLSGGKFELYDPEKNNKLVGRSESDENGEIMFVGKLVENHEYILKETEAPEGYDLVDELADGITVHTTQKGYNNALEAKENNIITNPKHHTEIKVFKQDGQGNLVEGAQLNISWQATKGKKIANGGEWFSGTGGHPFVADYDTVYTLEEVKTPYGYHTAEPVMFKVVDGQLMVRNDDNTWANADKVVMIDVPKDSVEIKIKDISAEQKNDLEGGVFRVVDEDGNQIGDTWTGNGGPKSVVLSDGKYKIVEVSAPVGYKAPVGERSIPLEVTTDGRVIVDGDELDPADPTIIFEEEYDENQKATVEFDSEELGINPDIFKSMKFALYRLDHATGQRVLVEPTDVDSETGALRYDINYQDEYILLPEETPNGYDPVEPITIKVVGTVDDNGDLVDDLRAKSASNPAYASLSMEDLGARLQPKLTPEEPKVPEAIAQGAATDGALPSNNKQPLASASADVTVGAAGGSSKVYPTGSRDEDGYLIKEKDIQILADNNADSAKDSSNDSKAPRLAKTGGFIGTVMGYGAALALMALGFVLVFGRKKSGKK